MLSNNFIWQPNLPSINDKNIKEFINEVNYILGTCGIEKILEQELEDYIDNNKIKRYKRINSYNRGKNFNKIGLADLNLNDFIIIKDLGYEISIKHNSPINPIELSQIENRNDWKKRKEILKKISDSNKLVELKRPWQIKIDKIKTKRLKTQDNIQILFAIGINPSTVNINSLSKEKCNHNFRLLDIKRGSWKWKLVWECVNCGLLCHCKCFESAIKQYNKENNTSSSYEKKRTGIDYSKLSFHKNACEICRGEVSTDKYCHEMYARSEFEIRYGAYVRKKYYELKAQNIELDDELELMKYANNIMREKLGFKKIGKKFITETELYRIVNSIFSKKKVIHHYRDDWLGRQEIDIFIPELNLGIEYNGKQHFEPIEAWGGKEALKENKQRDKLKKDKCEKEGVKLVSFNYKEKEKLNKNFVYKKIKFTLKENKK